MILARIVGTVVATRKDPRLVSTKLLVARPMDPHGKPEGNYLVAVDTVDAGVGETTQGPVSNEPARRYAAVVMGLRNNDRRCTARSRCTCNSHDRLTTRPRRVSRTVGRSLFSVSRGGASGRNRVGRDAGARTRMTGFGVRLP